ncbi:MAG: RIP metalloprotease RseP [Limnochordia bacterium]
MTNLVAFIFVFGTIVFFHEMGHFIVAKLVGIKVYEFSLGFGPALLSFKGGETYYSLRLLPLGGFVKLAGMDPSLSEEEAIPSDDPRSFYAKPIWQRMATIAAGPMMNFILASILFAVYFMTVQVFPPMVTGVLQDSPAYQAGLQPGDRIISVAGKTIDDVGQVTKLIQANPGRSVTIVVERDGKKESLEAIPEPYGPQGLGRIGVGIDEQRRDPPHIALPKGFGTTHRVTIDLVRTLTKMFTGQVEAEFTGPVGIYQLVGESARQGFNYLLMLAAILNINLGLLNFLPIPILDGGWLLFLGLEGIRGKPIDPDHQGLAQFIGLALLILLMLFATYRDFLRILPS